MSNQKTIIIIADAWGMVHGGINAFNFDFTLALGKILKGYAKIICAVKQAAAEIPHPDIDNVELIIFNTIPEDDPFDERWVDKLYRGLESIVDTTAILWWVGHDAHTGPLAAALKKEFGKGKLALIKHMSYISYQPYKTGSETALEKDKKQRALFSSADQAFAVGPLLFDSLRKLMKPRQDNISTIIPGLAEVDPDYSVSPFTAVIYGRLDSDNNRIKQFRLAVHAFAAAVRKAEEQGYPDALKEMPRLIAIGLPTEDLEEEKRLRAEINKKASKVFQLIVMPYMKDREELFYQLGACSIALMPSWHEGFSLAGWEAIAAEVPLVTGKNTGLFRLINEKLGDNGTVSLKAISIDGAEGEDEKESYSDRDLDRVRDAIIEVAKDPVRANKNAKRLKKDLVGLGFSWANAAKEFATRLGFTEIVKDPSGFIDEETEKYVSSEVREILISNGYTSFFAIDDSIRLVQLDMNGHSHTDADSLEVQCHFPAGMQVQAEDTNPSNEKLNASIKCFTPKIQSYLRSQPFFKADESWPAEWKLGMEQIQPPLEVFRKPLKITVHPLSFTATKLFNRRIVNGRVAVKAGRSHPYPEIRELYEESITHLLSNNDVFEFQCPSQLFVELAILTADKKILLIQKTAGEPGSGVVAELKRSWTCGPEFGLTFKHLRNNNLIMLHPAVLAAMESEFGVRETEVCCWHIGGLALQHVHLNAALYGYCEISLEGKELVDRFRATKNKQFKMTLQGPNPYPELVNLNDIPNLLEEKERYNGDSWHPTAKIRLHTLYNRHSG